MTQHTGTTGIWTPNARILCPTCTGLDLRPVTTTGTLAYCDECNADLAVDADLGAEQALVRALKAAGVEDASMWQTGGMCSAVGWTFEGGYAMATSGDDADDFLVCTYTTEGDMPAHELGHDLSIDEVVAFATRKTVADGVTRDAVVAAIARALEGKKSWVDSEPVVDAIMAGADVREALEAWAPNAEWREAAMGVLAMKAASAVEICPGFTIREV